MSNNSKVLALKYRPKTFEDLIGQETVAEVIYNSIANDRSANAYLFTGIRGCLLYTSPSPRDRG